MRAPATASLFVPFILGALVVVAGFMLLPIGPQATSVVSDSAPAEAADAESGQAFTVHGVTPQGTLQVYAMGLVVAISIVGVALITRGRFYP